LRWNSLKFIITLFYKHKREVKIQIIAFLSIVLISFVIGGFTVASGQIFLAIREIALNTRKEDSEERAEYGMLETMAKLNNFIGWVIVVFGLILGLVVAFATSSRSPYLW